MEGGFDFDNKKPTGRVAHGVSHLNGSAVP